MIQAEGCCCTFRGWFRITLTAPDFALACVDFYDVDLNVPERISLERLFRLVTFNLRQTADRMPLQAATTASGAGSIAEARGNSHLRIRKIIAFAPFFDRPDVVAKLPPHRRVQSFRSLYESSDSVRRRGAFVKNLSLSASF